MKILLSCLLAFSATSSYACSLDIMTAESSLRIVLDRAADGGHLPRSMRTHSRQMEAMRILLHIEQRSPGLLEGKDASCEGLESYETVRELYRDFEAQESF